MTEAIPTILTDAALRAFRRQCLSARAKSWPERATPICSGYRCRVLPCEGILLLQGDCCCFRTSWAMMIPKAYLFLPHCRSALAMGATDRGEHRDIPLTRRQLLSCKLGRAWSDAHAAPSVSTAPGSISPRFPARGLLPTCVREMKKGRR